MAALGSLRSPSLGRSTVTSLCRVTVYSSWPEASEAVTTTDNLEKNSTCPVVVCLAGFWSWTWQILSGGGVRWQVMRPRGERRAPVTSCPGDIPRAGSPGVAGSCQHSRVAYPGGLSPVSHGAQGPTTLGQSAYRPDTAEPAVSGRYADWLPHCGCNPTLPHRGSGVEVSGRVPPGPRPRGYGHPCRAANSHDSIRASGRHVPPGHYGNMAPGDLGTGLVGSGSEQHHLVYYGHPTGGRGSSTGDVIEGDRVRPKWNSSETLVRLKWESSENQVFHKYL